MTPNVRLPHLYDLATRAWPDAQDIKVEYTDTRVTIRTENEVVMLISCNEYAFEAADAALEMLLQTPGRDRTLTELQRTHAEIRAKNLHLSDIRSSETVIENAKRLGVSPSTVKTIIAENRQ